MSIQHMQMVLDADDLSSSEKIVLLAYCNYTDAHGYVWAGVSRISDDSGASPATVKRVRSTLQQRGLLATKRRVDRRTGRSTSNITRINLTLLASMKRAPREYDDNVIEELTFDPDPDPSETCSDLRIAHSEPGADLRIAHFEPTPGLKMSPPEGGLKMSPNPSVDPSGSSSSGGSGGVGVTPGPVAPAEEDEESPSAGKQQRRGQRPVDLVLAATDATPDEAQQLVEILRPEAKTSLGGLIRLMAENGDLTHRLWRLRRQRASEGRTEASGGARPAVCGLHGCQLPCGPCRGDLNAGGECAQRVVDMYAGLGADAAALRPDVAGHPVIAALAVTG